MSSKVKKIIGIVVVIIIAMVAYRFFFVSETEPTLERSDVSSQAVGRELLTLLSTLQSLNLDGGVLDNPEFLSLEDFSVPVTANLLGRRNPFAPIGVGNVLGVPDSTQEAEFEEPDDLEEEEVGDPSENVDDVGTSTEQ